jgi:ABC-type dipeptide/oligopeptide/nickel transport system permease component
VTRAVDVAAPPGADPGAAGGRWRDRHPWIGFLTRRLTRLVLALAALLTATFGMIHLVPGDPVRAALGPDAPFEVVEARRAALGLNRPIAAQYADYVSDVFRGDFGRSLLSDESVTAMIADRLPNTLRLAALAFLLAVLLSMPIGMAVAVLTREGRRRGTDLAFTSVTGVLGVIPEFLLAVGLVFVFAATLGSLPSVAADGPASYVLPAVALALPAGAMLARIVRVETVKVLGEDYMRTARSKRLPGRLLYLRHALPNMLTATLTLGGLLLAGLIGGSVLVENVFAWPGLGTMAVQAILTQDYPVAQAAVVIYGLAVLGANLVVDLLLAVLDPRSSIRDSS